MNNWMEETLQAPRDAWGLLLGLATSFSIFALLRHEFANEPLRVVLQNWALWSHLFWGWFAGLLQLQVSPILARCLTVLALSCAVLLRGFVRRQSLPEVRISGSGANRTVIGFLLLLLYLAVFVAMLMPIALAIGNDEPMTTGLELPIAVASALVLTIALIQTPRSFWGVVLASAALFAVGTIPIPVASGS